MSRPLPPSASVAEPGEGGKLFAPSAARNAPLIAAELARRAPQKGRAQEIASGTGQHVVAYARALPGLTWQPTEVAPDRLASIAAYRAESGLENIAPPAPLDACAPGWGADWAGQDLVVLVNLTHLIPEAALRTLLGEVARALAPGGLFFLYGPFKRSGQLTSAGDARFDGELRAADPAIGYKDDLDMARWLGEAGIALAETLEMPANNLVMLARKPL